MRRGCIFTLIFLLWFIIFGGAHAASLVAMTGAAAPQPGLRIALVGSGRAKLSTLNVIDAALVDALAREPKIVVVDQSMIQPALTGIGYDGSINLSKDEARKIAAAIGCDFFIVGKAEVFPRSEREGESHQQAYVALLIVDGRSGALADFVFISEKAASSETALSEVTKTFERRASEFVDRMTQFRAQVASQRTIGASSSVDLIEDIPAEDSPRAVGFKAPEFLNRVKPEYTSEAGLADIRATVEAMVVFRRDGEVGAVEITRWAGFGLDEAATRAIRQLKFKPATRDGRPISVRALVQYNFRRVTDTSTTIQPTDSKPEKSERDLRQLFKPTYRRP